MPQERCGEELLRLLAEIRGALIECRQALHLVIAAGNQRAQRERADHRPGGYIDIKAAAEYLGVHHRTLRRGLRDIDCPLRYIKVGSALRFKREWLDEWVDRQTRGRR